MNETSSPWQKLWKAISEIVQPFFDLVKAPRALWGIHLAYAIEGLAYFGILGYLTLHFSDFVFQGVENSNDWAHKSVTILTAGITLSMVVLGGVADKKGIRFALIAAFVFLLAGRALMAAAPNVLGLQPTGLWSPLHLVTVAGMLLIVIGYGMYQPAAYAGVRAFTSPKNAGTNFIMLYAVMNLGGWFPTFAFLLRDEDYVGLGIPGVFWVYTGFTALALVCTMVLLTSRTERDAMAAAKEETARIKDIEGSSPGAQSDKEFDRSGAGAAATEHGRHPVPMRGSAGNPTVRERIPIHLWGMMAGIVICLYIGLSSPWWQILSAACVLTMIVSAAIPSLSRWFAHHPLADLKFFFFIFALIPVQTLFVYNWLVLPPYIERSYEGWIGKYYEVFANQNPLLVFILAPMVGVLTEKWRVYDTMIYGTLVMAAPAFLLATGTTPVLLATYIVVSTVGEVMWQPRFLQYAAEIAPHGETGRYVGVAQWPWFLTKMLVPLLYSGKMMDRYCPAEGPKDNETMWMIFGIIALSSTIFLLTARGWVGMDFKTKAD